MESDFLTASDAMFGSHLAELLIVAVAAVLLFRQRLPETTHRDRYEALKRAWETDEVVTFFKWNFWAWFAVFFVWIVWKTF